MILCMQMNNLKLYAPTLAETQKEELDERRNKCSNRSFKLLGINVGELISFYTMTVLLQK